MSEALDIALTLCRKFEGFYAKPYLCPAGVPTIGYGTTYYEDGTKVKLSDPKITKERAEELLAKQLTDVYMAGVLSTSPILEDFPRSLGALTSFAYNLGVPRYQGSTLRVRVDEQNWDQARLEIVRWNRAGGRVLRGLALRRQAEAEYLGG